jgi:hypothetical protein
MIAAVRTTNIAYRAARIPNTHNRTSTQYIEPQTGVNPETSAETGSGKSLDI